MSDTEIGSECRADQHDNDSNADCQEKDRSVSPEKDFHGPSNKFVVMGERTASQDPSSAVGAEDRSEAGRAPSVTLLEWWILGITYLILSFCHRMSMSLRVKFITM